MNTFKILIATGVIILVGSLLTGCKTSDSVSNAVQGLREAAHLAHDAELSLSGEHQSDTLTVKVTLQNPTHKPITSVQSWLTFDPKKLQGTGVDISKSPFSLTAPFENTFDNQDGLVRLGRGSDKPLSDGFLTVATLTFKVVSAGTTMMDAYDYRSNLRGHASANVVINGQPYNVLKKPLNPLLVIQ